MEQLLVVRRLRRLVGEIPVLGSGDGHHICMSMKFEHVPGAPFVGINRTRYFDSVSMPVDETPILSDRVLFSLCRAPAASQTVLADACKSLVHFCSPRDDSRNALASALRALIPPRTHLLSPRMAQRGSRGAVLCFLMAQDFLL